LLAGTSAAAAVWLTTIAEGKGGLITILYTFQSTMAQNYWIAIISWSVCAVVTIAISLVTQPKTDAELHNLVYGVTEMPPKGNAPWYQRPGPLAVVVIAVLVVVNLIFW
jgi:SSS family solute:Na+ symporter